MGRRLKRFKNNSIYAGARLANFLGRRLPRKIGVALFGAIGTLGWLIAAGERRKTLENLRLIYGNRLSAAQISRLGRTVFANLGRNLFDSLHLLARDSDYFDRIVKHDEFSLIDQAYREGKGVIMVTAHTGCFEMLLQFFARKGYGTFAIGRASYDSRIDELIRSARTGSNFEYLHRTENPRVILRKLQAGKVMGVLIDQDTATEGVFAHFLGRLAYTPSGPAKIAMRYKIPLFVVTTARQKDGTHRIFFSSRLELLDSGEFNDDLVRNVEAINAFLCKTIEEYPEQWVWMHKRWKHQPGKGFEDVPNIEKINPKSEIRNSKLETMKQ
jgi:KDO2-lipid IV(A) lauroyltransferase